MYRPTGENVAPELRFSRWGFAISAGLVLRTAKAAAHVMTGSFALSTGRRGQSFRL